MQMLLTQCTACLPAGKPLLLLLPQPPPLSAQRMAACQLLLLLHRCPCRRPFHCPLRALQPAVSLLLLLHPLRCILPVPLSHSHGLRPYPCPCPYPRPCQFPILPLPLSCCSFPALSCEFATLDISDALGTVSMAMIPVFVTVVEGPRAHATPVPNGPRFVGSHYNIP